MKGSHRKEDGQPHFWGNPHRVCEQLELSGCERFNYWGAISRAEKQADGYFCWRELLPKMARLTLAIH
jgi:hypothetical protein